MFKTIQFDKTLDLATSHLKLETDWTSMMQICDMIRQNDVTAKTAIAGIIKKISSPNPHTALYALMVLESVVKNCGAPIHEEISNKSSCETFAALVRNTRDENVRNKMLELIQSWSIAFRTAHKYRGIKDIMNILKTEGYKFPEVKDVTDSLFTADVAPEWADGEVCYSCRTGFSVLNRKHHCRNCGQVFCGQCSSKNSTIPKFGIEKEVRVCDRCFDQLQKSTASTPSSKEDELPVEYLKSSLAQQSQLPPPRKTEEELREEEELQLALALSQSEAESKKKSSFVPQPLYKSPSPVRRRSLTPEPETPSDPELARYLNRSYWENRQTVETPASPSAPSPMNSTISMPIQKSAADNEQEIDDFMKTFRTQVEIFVNRMKSNSSRGRSISNDTSVQTLFMNITSMHSRLLSYIKEMDDKRLWHEQLQDKMSQVRDSRAALDVLRQEHQDQLRRIAEEQERQRQMQMAYKLEIMRKKKQEYLQYQRQLALQRIQEQEREMQMRQEQQKAQYMMSAAGGFPYQGVPPNVQNSPLHHPGQFNQYGNYPPPGPDAIPNQHGAFMPINPVQNMMHVPSTGTPMTHGQQQPMQNPNMPGQTGVHQMHPQMGMMQNHPGMPQQQLPQQGMHPNMNQQQQQPPPNQMPQQQQQMAPQQPQQQLPPMQQQQIPTEQPQQQAPNPPVMQQQPPPAAAPTQPVQQTPQAPAAAQPAPEAEKEVETAELITF